MLPLNLLSITQRHMIGSDTMLHKRTWTPPLLGKTTSIQSSKRAYWREGGNEPSGISEPLPKIHKLAINGTATGAAAATSTVTGKLI